MHKRKKLSEEDVAENKRLYDLYHNSFQMEDGWYPGNKEKNFAYLVKIAQLTNVSLSGTSCLDVGCGTGDFSLFLRERGVTGYLGLDIYEPSLKKARKKYPHESFLLGDFLAFPITTSFTYVFCSGALTVRMKSMDNYDYLSSFVAKMCQIASVGVAFNILTDDEPIKTPQLFFYSEEKVVEMCKSIAPFAQVISEKTPNVHQSHIYLYQNSAKLL